MDAEVHENAESKVTHIKETLESLKKDAAEIQGKARETIHQLRDRSQVYQDSARQIFDQAAEYCNENPQRAAMIAGAAGVSVGILIGLMLRK